MPKFIFKIKTITVCLFLLIYSTNMTGQNTVGLISIDHEKSIGGYNLIYPEGQPDVFLLNGCGEIVHTWEDEDSFRPGKTAYLLDNGNLLRAKASNAMGNSFGAGGAGGIVEILTWDSELEWSFTLADSLNRQHHDVLSMENGNVLMIAWEWKNLDALVDNGFDTFASSITTLWPDYLLEINPATNERVWEWHAWDHLVQDYNPNKLNFGVIAEHPELIDINYKELSFERQDFMHTNAIDYDPVKDQVLMSVRNFNEIWIIDHSTTTAEAGIHTGGNSGKGGDLIFRWGNPVAYNNGGLNDQQLFSQHDAQWIDDFVDPSYEHFGEIVLFNNKASAGVSLGQILSPAWDAATHSYLMENGIYLPNGFSETFSHPDPAKNYSSNASSIQVIGNGTVMMCAATQGFIFELTKEGEVVWEYRTPLRLGQPIPQGFELSVSDNFTFQCEKYPEDFPGFIGKDLSPKGHIELSPNISFCTFTDVEEINEKYLTIFPNPAMDFMFLENKTQRPLSIEIFDYSGRIVFTKTINENNTKINISNWPDGVYFLREKDKGIFRKIIKIY